MSRLFDALDNSADGAFVVDEDLRIVYFNKAAEAMLGFDNEEVVGQFCYRVMRGHADGGHLVCKAQCQVAKMTLKSKPVPNYDIHIATNYGVKRWMNMSVFAYKLADTDSKKVVVHLFHDLNHKKVNDKLMTDIIGAINHTHENPPKNGNETEPLLETLTQREREILTLLVEGHGTRDIAKLLSISLNTARNHIQRILQKLQVHTRLEAVAIAIKHNFAG